MENLSCSISKLYLTSFHVKQMRASRVCPTIPKMSIKILPHILDIRLTYCWIPLYFDGREGQLYPSHKFSCFKITHNLFHHWRLRNQLPVTESSPRLPIQPLRPLLRWPNHRAHQNKNVPADNISYAQTRKIHRYNVTTIISVVPRSQQP